jgi:hypothetical protein
MQDPQIFFVPPPTVPLCALYPCTEVGRKERWRAHLQGRVSHWPAMAVDLAGRNKGSTGAEGTLPALLPAGSRPELCPGPALVSGWGGQNGLRDGGA